MKAVIYARVSSKDQEREGYSIPAQLELLRSYAINKGFQVIQEYTESETAKSSGREEFGKMVALLKGQKQPVCVLVEKTDRLYRNIKDFILVDELMNNHLVEVHKVKEGKVITNDIHSSEKFMELIKVGMAKQYIDNLSEEVKKGQRQKVKEGGWAWPAPYGYRNNRETKGIEPHPEHSVFVQKAFEIYSRGFSISATAQKLYDDGFFYRASNPIVNKTKLRDILASRVYIGEIVYSGETYQGKHQPLVPRDLWYQVQVLLKKGNKPMELTKRDFLFKGKLTCGECGKPLVGELKKGGKYVYYRCVDMKQACSQGYTNETVIEKAFTSFIESLQLTDEMKADMRAAIDEVGDLKDNTVAEEASRIEKDINRISKNRRTAYQDKLDGVIDAAMYQEIVQEYNEQMEILERKLAGLKNADDAFYNYSDKCLELPELLNSIWLRGSAEEKKDLMNLVTSNLKIKDGKADVELVSVLSDLLDLSTRSEWRGNRNVLRTYFQKHSVTIRELHKALTA